MSSSSSSSNQPSGSSKRARDNTNVSDVGELNLLLTNEPLSGPVVHSQAEEEDDVTQSTSQRAAKRRKTKHPQQADDAEEEEKLALATEEENGMDRRLERLEKLMESVVERLKPSNKEKGALPVTWQMCPVCKAYDTEQCTCLGEFCSKCGVNAKTGRHALACPLNAVERRGEYKPHEDEMTAMSIERQAPAKPSQPGELSAECKKLVVDRLYADLRLWDPRTQRPTWSQYGDETCTVGYDPETGARTITVATSKAAVNKIVISDASVWSLLFGRYTDDVAREYPDCRSVMRKYHDFIIEKSFKYTWASLVCMDTDLRMLMAGGAVDLTSVDASKLAEMIADLQKKEPAEMTNTIRCNRCGVVNHHQSSHCLSRSEKAPAPIVKKAKKDDGGEGRPAGVCKFFNLPRGCFKKGECQFLHQCTSCGKAEHGAAFHTKPNTSAAKGSGAPADQ